jgi:hypothetical protein
MSEQENVRQLQLEHLKVQRQVSISFDGGAIRSGESFYTVHATTVNRKVMLLDGQDGTNESHTGAWIADLVLRVRFYLFSECLECLLTARLLRTWPKLGRNA